MNFDPTVLLTFPVFVLSIVVHECAHGWMALWNGDPTAKEQGRLTLNPLPHVDLMGSILLPGVLLLTHAPFLFGWAKPVPVDWSRLRRPQDDQVKVALAGPASNLLLALGFAALARVAPEHGFWAPLKLMGLSGVVWNCALAIFNLIPIPPLDGAWVLMRFLPMRHIIVLQQFRSRRHAGGDRRAERAGDLQCRALHSRCAPPCRRVSDCSGSPRGGDRAVKTGRILSGMRPTGRLHLGNFVGALENWVRLQDAGWTNYHMVADWHMLTYGFEDTSNLASDTHEMVVDWLAAGLDPARSVIFVQSAVKEHARAAPAALDAGQQGAARAHPDPQGADPRPSSRRADDLVRASRLLGAAGGGHPALQGDARSGGRGPGAARRADPRAGPPIQLRLLQGPHAGVPGARGAAHPSSRACAATMAIA
jgi:Zn-dependent protease